MIAHFRMELSKAQEKKKESLENITWAIETETPARQFPVSFNKVENERLPAWFLVCHL